MVNCFLSPAPNVEAAVAAEQALPASTDTRKLQSDRSKALGRGADALAAAASARRCVDEPGSLCKTATPRDFDCSCRRAQTQHKGDSELNLTIAP